MEKSTKKPAPVQAAESLPKCRRLQRAILDILREHEQQPNGLPTSARFVYYELVQRGVIAKKPAGDKIGGRRPDQDVAVALFTLRMNGLVPWTWIVVETRSLKSWRFANSAAEYVKDTVDLSRIDVWAGERPPMILTESRSLAGVLHDLAYEYLTPIAATNGQVGGFLRTDIAPALDVQQRVLYLGDFDWQGAQIEQNTRRVLEDLIGGALDWQRVAITEQQVRDHNLPVISKPDRRYKPVRSHDAVETEALGQSTIVSLVRDHLDHLLPEPLVDVRTRTGTAGDGPRRARSGREETQMKSMRQKNPRLEAALSFVRRQWEVFPVPPGTKCGYSVAQRGFDNGAPWGKTKDEGEVRAYWFRLPRASIGIPMGIGSGIFDVECDTRRGHRKLKQDGAESLAALEAKHGKLPATLMFVSPSGSVHRLFKHPGDGFHVEHSTSKLGIGIDVIGDGFMSVVPPSRKGKGCYRWLNDLPIADASPWLLELVRKPAPVPRTFVSDAELPSREVVILALALLPNNDPKPDWKFWKNVGMAIYASTGGTGNDLWHAWSRKHGHYDAADTDIAWDKEITKCPPNRYGPRAIINKIEEVMPDWQTAVLNSAYDKQIKAFLKLLDEVA